MMMEERHTGNESEPKETFIVRITNSMLYDRLHTLSAEYSVSEELLVNIAVKRLLNDVELMRNLRSGKIKPE